MKRFFVCFKHVKQKKKSTNTRMRTSSATSLISQISAHSDCAVHWMYRGVGNLVRRGDAFVKTSKTTIVAPYNASVLWLPPFPENSRHTDAADPFIEVGGTIAVLHRIPDDTNVYFLANTMRRCIARNVISRFGAIDKVCANHVIGIGSDLRYRRISDMRPYKMTHLDHDALFAAKSGQSDDVLFSCIVQVLLEYGDQSEISRTPTGLRGDVHM